MDNQTKISKNKRIKIKKEFKDEDKAPLKDLTHYKKDRVELMKQVFSIMLDKELLAMAPAAFRGLGVGTIRELLLDEVLGISSKRLQSILDGYKCPSDTESSDESSNDAIETISLDSISSGDDILLQQSNKQKKKHSKKKNAHQTEKDSKKKAKSVKSESVKEESSKTKKKKKESKEPKKLKDADESETGMTVLELLELQARARAIRAQLAAVEVKSQNSIENNENKQDCSQSSESDADEVVIKEEPPDIVEINSSSDEIELKTDKNISSSSKTKDDTPTNKSNKNKSSTNDAQPRKIKLNRNNLLVSVSNLRTNCIVNEKKSSDSKNETSKTAAVERTPDSIKDRESIDNEVNNKKNNDTSPVINKVSTVKTSQDQYQSHMSDDDDDDEIKLDLSDSEKMDVLEDLHSPESHSTLKLKNNSSNARKRNLQSNNRSTINNNSHYASSSLKKTDRCEKIRKVASVKIDDFKTDKLKNKSDKVVNEETTTCVVLVDETNTQSIVPNKNDSNTENNRISIENINSEMSEGECSNNSDSIEITEMNLHESVLPSDEKCNSVELASSTETKDDINNDITELDQNESIQLISIEGNTINVNRKESDSQPETDLTSIINDNTADKSLLQSEINVNDGDDYVLEISDNSADDATDAFSKEPTREEIEELSRKIDTEIDRENFSVLDTKSMDLKIRDDSEESQCDTEVSWKSRWLESGKVRKVLVTSQLCNALRKKNKELKKKLEKEMLEKQSTCNSELKLPDDAEVSTSSLTEKVETLEDLTEGSVSQYEALPGSTKYVAPVIVTPPDEKVTMTPLDEKVTMTPPDEKAMVSDAKQLMKMYKKLIKINCSDEDSKKSQIKKHKKEKKKNKKDKKDKEKKNDKAAVEPMKSVESVQSVEPTKSVEPVQSVEPVLLVEHTSKPLTIPENLLVLQ